MIDHDGARELAASALDFDLSPEDDARLLAHIVECASCRAFAEALDADRRSFADLASQDAPEALRSRILAAFVEPGLAPEPAPATTRAVRDPAPGLSVIARRYRWPLGLATAAVIVVAIIGGGLAWRPVRGPDVAIGSPAAPSGSGAVPSAPPLPSIDPGSRLVASPWAPVADLVADDVVGGVVSLASGFRLTSLDGTPAIDLAKRLTVTPPIAFAVAADSDGTTVRITPSEPLTPGTAYHFSLRATDGHEVGSWAFQAHQPLRIIGTLPRDTETDVPLDTGIEVTFDQDGVLDAASHVTISPHIDGRFEEHGRTLAFVPDQRLAPATIYSVSVSAGIEVSGTGERLESDAVFRFETAIAGETPDPIPSFQFTDDMFESATTARPVIAVWTFQDSDDEDTPTKAPTSAPIEIFRIDGLDAAMDAFRQVRSSPRWSRRGAMALVPTTGLTRVMALDVHLQDADGILWSELPEPLPAGSYLVQLTSPTRPIQAILQVTDIASYLVVSDTKTLLWANDLATGGPLAGARVTTSGTDLGRTGADGTLIATTPASVTPEPRGTCAIPCLALVTVRDGERTAFLPAGDSSDPDGKDSGRIAVDDGLRYWHTFDTDRTLYRRTDTVNTWGVVRDRDTGDVPSVVSISLSATDQSTGLPGPALISRDVHPNAIGALHASLAFDGLPEGFYLLQLRVAGKLVTSTGIDIGRILKPAYKLDVTTGRRVYVEGDQIRVTAHAAFYEGSPVPGIRLRSDGFVEAGFTTDASGTATRRTVAHIGRSDEDSDAGEPDIQAVNVTPASTEEGEISSASRYIVVFPSHSTMSGTTSIRDGRVRVSGHLAELDRDRLEREVSGGADPWSIDAAGAAIPDHAVALTFIKIVTTRVETGTRYDFIEKKVVPTYEYRTNEQVVRTVQVRTDSKGRFAGSIPAAAGVHSYRILAKATDQDGHVARWVVWASEPSEDVQDDNGPSLALTTDPTSGVNTFGVGDRIDVTMSDPTATGEGAHDRYLFFTAQRGLREVTVQDGKRYRTTFGPTAPPSLLISAVRFTGTRYTATATFGADLRATDREITVGLTTDKARYAPGDDVRLRVTTRDRSGDPVAATVVLRAVDEKLFALGGAAASDPLTELYVGVDAGIRVTYRSHRSPRTDFETGGGDTGGGGGERDDFRDLLLFQSVDTGADGRASLTMHLSDDLTSWRVSASAIGAGLEAGEGTVLVPVGLPFFADATIAPEYLLSDRPEIGIRAFGTALDAASPVTFAVDSDDLGMHVTGLRAKAFETIRVALPALSLGRHTVTITAKTGTGSSARQDRLVRTFSVVASRLEATQTSYAELTGVSHVQGGDGLTEVTVSDAGVGRYAPLLLELADVDSSRLERVLAAAIASSVARERFHVDAGGAATTFEGDPYQTPDGGLAVVPYASSDLETSALAALVAPDRIDAARLADYLSAITGSATETRERRNVALAGLAGLGKGVLPEIRAAAADPGLTIRERLLLGLGAASLGDAATAHAVAASLVDGYGEALGEQARLRVGNDAADVTQATALMALLAAANDDPLAPRFWAYVEANPDDDATYALHAVGFVDRMLEHARPAAASFAYVSGGDRTVVELGPGETFHLTLVGSQLDAFAVEPISGRLALTSSWQAGVDPGSFQKDPDVSIVRTVTPKGVIGASAVVTVDLDVDLGPRPATGCHAVTDFVPSGLIPVGNVEGWVDPDDEQSVAANATYPYAQVGQRVSFCAEPRANGGIVHLRYVARVVSTGTYTWEPAIARSPSAGDRAALTGATTITIH